MNDEWIVKAMELADEYAAFCLTASAARRVIPPGALPAWQELTRGSREALVAHLVTVRLPQAGAATVAPPCNPGSHRSSKR